MKVLWLIVRLTYNCNSTANCQKQVNTHSSFLPKYVWSKFQWTLKLTFDLPMYIKKTNTPINRNSLLTYWERRPHLYLFLRGNKSLLYHQTGNRNFFIFITIQWNLMFCVDKIEYEHLAILSNLKSCQFAPRIVIFNLCICCQFEDSKIILPKIIHMSHHNI